MLMMMAQICLSFPICSQEEKLHSLLAVAYVAQIQPALHRREEADSGVREAREKLQQLLWQSSLFDSAAVLG